VVALNCGKVAQMTSPGNRRDRALPVPDNAPHVGDGPKLG
jgi:hypothetical protein